MAPRRRRPRRGRRRPSRRSTRLVCIGTITDENKKPVVGVQITVTCPEVSTFKLETTSDAKGNWAVTLIDATKSYNYKYEKPGHQTMQQDFKAPIGTNVAQGLPDAVRRRSDQARRGRGGAAGCDSRGKGGRGLQRRRRGLADGRHGHRQEEDDRGGGARSEADASRTRRSPACSTPTRTTPAPPRPPTRRSRSIPRRCVRCASPSKPTRRSATTAKASGGVGGARDGRPESGGGRSVQPGRPRVQRRHHAGGSQALRAVARRRPGLRQDSLHARHVLRSARARTPRRSEHLESVHRRRRRRRRRIAATAKEMLSYLK